MKATGIVRRMDFGMIELFTEDHNFTLDADAFSIPGEINPLD